MMKHFPEKEQLEEPRAEYESPAIVYEDKISTRAGSPLGNPSGSDGIDPADLFD
jgi:hypothetical protein